MGQEISEIVANLLSTATINALGSTEIIASAGLISTATLSANVDDKKKTGRASLVGVATLSMSLSEEQWLECSFITEIETDTNIITAIELDVDSIAEVLNVSNVVEQTTDISTITEPRRLDC